MENLPKTCHFKFDALNLFFNSSHLIYLAAPTFVRIQTQSYLYGYDDLYHVLNALYFCNNQPHMVSESHTCFHFLGSCARIPAPKPAYKSHNHPSSRTPGQKRQILHNTPSDFFKLMKIDFCARTNFVSNRPESVPFFCKITSSVHVQVFNKAFWSFVKILQQTFPVKFSNIFWFIPFYELSRFTYCGG